MESTKYELYDIVDDESVDVLTLKEAKDWLIEHWTFNSDDLTEEELSEMKMSVDKADDSEIFDRLNGIGYAIFPI